MTPGEKNPLQFIITNELAESLKGKIRREDQKDDENCRCDLRKRPACYCPASALVRQK
jgi:hypothetical protein